MKTKQFDALLARFSAETIISTLSPMILERRRERIDHVLKNRIHSIHVAVESPCDIHNALAIVRTAEAMGVVKIHLIAPELKRRTGWSTTKGSMLWTEITTHPSTTSFLEKEKGLLLAGACVDAEMSLHEVPVEKPLCILLGNESRGLSKEAKESCQIRYTIPMGGMVESFNLSVAGAISLYEVVRRKREWLRRAGDLDETQLIAERARYYLLALGVGRAVKILENSCR